MFLPSKTLVEHSAPSVRKISPLIKCNFIFYLLLICVPLQCISKCVVKMVLIIKCWSYVEYMLSVEIKLLNLFCVFSSQKLSSHETMSYFYLSFELEINLKGVFVNCLGYVSSD